MKYPILLTMSLLSLLFGCRNKKTPDAPEPWPQFPESDHPALRIEPVALDSEYTIQAFFIADDKKAVYAMAFRRTVANPLNRYEEDEAECRIFCLDTQGKILKRLDQKHTQWVSDGSFGMLDGELLVMLWQNFLVLDPEKFVFKEKIPIYDSNFFPSKLKLEEMTFDELRDNYNLAFTAMLDQCTNCRWLDWTPGGAYYVLAPGVKGKRSAWSPFTYMDEDIEPLKKRFPLLSVTLPQQPDNQISDGAGTLREVEYLSAGTQLVYPNYKSRRTLQYELTLGGKKAHFSTTDRGGRALHVGYADNLALTTADGAAWVIFEGQLYRMQ